MAGKEKIERKTKILKFEYLNKEINFLEEIKRIFHSA